MRTIKSVLLISLLVLVTFGSVTSCESDSKAVNSANFELSFEEKSKYMEQGKKIAAASFQTLSGTLKKAIADHSIEGAIGVCNLQALSLTDSLSKEYKATVKRTSLKVRNQLNKPTQNEKHILKLYSRAKDAQEDLVPIVIPDSNSITFYSPILVKPICLSCHGEPNETLAISTINLLRNKYPYDKAYGYQVGDLRGMWSIKFNKN